ncbi:GDP-D-glycero-alpha-D-manno-heptose dehydrogenase-like [Styela clava]
MADGLAVEEDSNLRYSYESPRFKVLVTGGAGYIGSTLVPMLLSEGYAVVIYDLFRWGMQPLLNSNLDTRHLEIINGDILDDITLESVVKSSNAVIHLAGIVSAPAFNRYPEIAKEVNERGTKILVDSLKPDQPIIFASVENVYGRSALNLKGPCTEDEECDPLSPFAATFVESEKLVLKSNGVVLRIPSAFGISPRMRLDLLVNNLVFQACTKGHIDLYQADFKRNFIHVQDLAKCHLFTLNNIDKMRGKAYNVGHESLGYSKRQICEIIKDQLPNIRISEPKDEAYKDADNRNFETSFERIKDVGFTVTKSIHDGVTELLKIVPHLSEAEIKKCQAL